MIPGHKPISTTLDDTQRDGLIVLDLIWFDPNCLVLGCLMSSAVVSKIQHVKPLAKVLRMEGSI